MHCILITHSFFSVREKKEWVCTVQCITAHRMDFNLTVIKHGVHEPCEQWRAHQNSISRYHAHHLKPLYDPSLWYQYLWSQPFHWREIIFYFFRPKLGGIRKTVLVAIYMTWQQKTLIIFCGVVSDLVIHEIFFQKFWKFYE